ncbi:MAG TPA: glycoside hydrolase family 92 protein, partial [Balneolaceae bacterium]|nr:glycoside hydrolase family 92 protein [Balneolaceae bacterium]
LNKIEVRSTNTAKLRTFYTALYHTMLAPTLYMDVNGQYRGADGKVHTANGFKNYSTFSLWDTYRAEHPLLTFTEPDRVNGMIRFMLAFYDQHGLLPVWELKANETNTMIGYHAVPVIADAYFKGFRDYDIQKAFEAMKKSANEGNDDVKLFNKYGYVPSNKTRESVSKTLEYAYDDWCIAQMAKALGKQEDYREFNKRAHYFENLYDPSTGFMRPKLANGEWEEPFDPRAAPTDFSKRNFTEANAWQYLWYVPQDVPKLMDLIGGQDQFEARLDTLFNTSPKVNEGGVPDMSGLIGQYVQGNEPDQQTPYMYDYAGAPWKTQKVVNTIVDSLYKDTPDGLPGNEDCGQMSAWYVFSALGFYPVNPANGVYEIGSPSFKKATINLENGKKFTVEARNVSDKNMYIQSATFDGDPYNKSYITYQDIKKGGVLVFQMGPKPNKQWAANSQPPSTAFGSE